MKRRFVLAAMSLICVMAVSIPGVRAQDIHTELSRMRLNIQEAERLNQELISRLTARVVQLNESNVALVNQMNALTGRLQEMETRNRQLELEMATLRKLLQDEIAARHEAMRKFAAEISREFALTRTRQTSVAPQPQTPTVPDGEYFEYVVQRGATLTAIAAAYNVPMSEICRVNNITPESVLRVGQKLLIPKK